MAAKVIKTQVKVVLPAGGATPAPPLGPILGQHGVAIMDFVNAYNQATQDKRGETIPAVITIYEDRSFDFELKAAPASAMIKEALKLKSGSGEPNKKKVGKLTQAQLTEIAEKKMQDLNANDVEAAKKIIAGTARSMGVEVEK